MQHAIRSVTRYWPVGLRIALPWMVLLALWQIAISFLEFPVTSRRLPIDIATVVGVLLAVSAIAVNWHRFVFFDEAPANVLFRVDLRTRKYFIRIIACTLAGTAIAIIPILFLSSLGAGNGMLIAPAAVVAYVFTIIFSLSLPPLALDRAAIGLIETVRMVRGNEVNMLGFAALNFVAMAAGVAASLALAAPLTLFPEPVIAILLPIVTLPVSIFTTLISISAVTTAYGFFVEGREL